jgi:endonuclease/exonuclease/phosphatase family metal-dependent hydrolase
VTDCRPADGLRVVSYNVRDLLDDRDAVAHVVRSCRPDLVCLQEAPRRRFGSRRLRRLARECGLRWVVGGRASGGTAVLVHPRLDVVSAEAARLPVAGRLTRTRGYALVRVVLPGGAEACAVSVHLPLRPAERLDHSRRVLDRLRELAPPPYVVAGDLNEPPGGPSWTQLGELVHDVVPQLMGHAGVPPLTYPARSPRHRIDAVLVSAGVRVRSLRVAGAAEGLRPDVLTSASDHLPLVADLTLPSPPTPC